MSTYKTLVLTVIFIATAFPALAHLFEWGDPHSKVVFRVPDTWRQMQPVDVRDAVRFRAPEQNQHAECRMRVEDDNQYAMYPEQISDHVHNVKIDTAFWNAVGVNDYRSHHLNNTQRRMGLGNGFATMADMTYVPMDRNINMRALIWASQYHNKLYTLTCASQFDAFYDWYPTFQYILSTVKMRKEYHELPSGDYRYFLGDDVLRVETLNGQGSYH